MSPEENPRIPRLRTSAGRCTWDAPRHFTENDALAHLGHLQQALKSPTLRHCDINLAAVEWADPAPLLCLILIIAESRLSRSRVVVDLGNNLTDHSSHEHRVFLKFFAQQNFLVSLGEHALLKCNGTIERDSLALREKLAIEPQGATFINADCISARILSMAGLPSNSAKLQLKVEELIREAQDRTLGIVGGSDPRARDMLFQKLRKLMFELLSNVAEHSHEKREPCFAGVFARVRGPKPLNAANVGSWVSQFERGKAIHGQNAFKLNPFSEWFELYICDVGRGITAHIQHWKPCGDPGIDRDLRAAQRAANPLRSIAYRLFRSALSRHERHDSSRTAITGLQHLGHLLAIGSDYCRIYSNPGTWIGDHVPWTKGHSHSTVTDAKAKPLSGTCFAISIQPTHSQRPNPDEWAEPSSEELVFARDFLKAQTTFGPRAAIEFFDRRIAQTCSPTDFDESSSDPLEAFILRPPRIISKIDVSRWLSLVAGFRHVPLERKVDSLYIVDLSPFQAVALRDIFENAEAHPDSSLDIYLVTEDWSVSCLATSRGKTSFSTSIERARNFLQPMREDVNFCMAELAVLLRQMDSEIFWGDEGEADPYFFEGPVEWPTSESSGESILLPRYLDFPRALTNPLRYRACRRALRRCLALFKGHQPVAADDLVGSLLTDAQSGSYGAEAKRSGPLVVVGSVAVTAGTVNRAKPSVDVPSLHVIVHGDAPANTSEPLLSAILWISDVSNGSDAHQHTRTQSAIKPWRRIPGTSYIAPLGDRSISVVRYERRPDGSLDFNAPLYARTPSQTYSDFEQLGVMKLGHWKYGSRHDLLTINMRVAFQISFLELGALYVWLVKQFARFFGKNSSRDERAHILIYPSHPVTDMLLDRIRQDPGFEHNLPEAGMIPVKFVGSHTVSPLFASQLVQHQIKLEIRKLRRNKWSAVILDDGAITGKHLRELTQMLQSLGASRISTCAILDRTSLPAQEGVMRRFQLRHRRFWRWDVPTMGHARDCPLCQATALVRTFFNRLSNQRQRERLQEWLDFWQPRDIDTQWHRGGMPTTHFKPAMRVAFGIDEDSSGKRHEVTVSHNTSTSATATLLELTRLTTRADVAIKKSYQVEGKYPDAAIEMIASQLLLFFDEFSDKEKHTRFMRLLELLWGRTDETAATSLAGLCMTLAQGDLLGSIWNSCQENLLLKRELKGRDAVLAVNLLRSRCDPDPIHVLVDRADEVARHNYVMLDVSSTLRRSIRDFLVRHRNPDNLREISVHANSSRIRLMRLARLAPTDDAERRMPTVSEVLTDMVELEQIVRHLLHEKVCEADLDGLSQRVAELRFSEGISTPEAMTSWARSAVAFLYGEAGKSTDSGLVVRLEKQLLFSFSKYSDLDNNLIAGISRDVVSRWAEITRSKGANGNAQFARRWIGHHSALVKPKILGSRQEITCGHWMYCDTFVRETIRDVFTNVYYSSGQIANPWPNEQNPGAGIEADMWWKFEADENYADLIFANASANRAVVLKQTVNIAGVGRVGGNIGVSFRETPTGESIVLTKLRIPLHSAFISGK